MNNQEADINTEEEQSKMCEKLATKSYIDYQEEEPKRKNKYIYQPPQPIRVKVTFKKNDLPKIGFVQTPQNQQIQNQQDFVNNYYSQNKVDPFLKYHQINPQAAVKYYLAQDSEYQSQHFEQFLNVLNMTVQQYKQYEDEHPKLQKEAIPNKLVEQSVKAGNMKPILKQQLRWMLLNNQLEYYKSQFQFDFNLEEEYLKCRYCNLFYEEEDNLAILQCGDIFHEVCIFQWTENYSFCPICKN